MERFAARNPELKDRDVLVVGLGRSGEAAAWLALSRGARVRVTDHRPLHELGDAVERLREAGAEIQSGGDPDELVRRSDLLVVSPGVPLTLPLFSAARAAGVPVWGEIELAGRFTQGRVIGITGSNGKSTTTSMVGTILRRAGIPGGTGGNLDIPFSDLLHTDSVDSVHAIELSSFQLESIEQFRPDVAMVLNLTPDHLDRYPSFDAYGRAKARLLEVQRSRDFAILNADDPEAHRFEQAARGRVLRFSTRGDVPAGAFVRDGKLILRTDTGDEALMPVDALPVPGEHNVANALAAALGCRLIGCTKEQIVQGLEAYRPLAHRLEPLGEIDGVTYFNDSKATNLDSAERALTSFPPHSVHVILGGKDKGADWPALATAVVRHALSVLLVGEAAPAIRDALGMLDVDVVEAGTIEAAVREGAQRAEPGEVVLLSPGCASFDQYPNFMARGDAFKRAVRALNGEGLHA